MTEISKSPEQEVSGEQKATGWESLENYGDGNTEDGSDYTHHSPFEKFQQLTETTSSTAEYSSAMQ